MDFPWCGSGAVVGRHHVEKRGGRGIGGRKSAWCWDWTWSRPLWNRVCGFMKGLGTSVASPGAPSCRQKIGSFQAHRHCFFKSSSLTVHKLTGFEHTHIRLIRNSCWLSRFHLKWNNSKQADVLALKTSNILTLTILVLCYNTVTGMQRQQKNILMLYAWKTNFSDQTAEGGGGQTDRRTKKFNVSPYRHAAIASSQEELNRLTCNH